MYHKRTKNDNKFIRPFMEKKDTGNATGNVHFRSTVFDLIGARGTYVNLFSTTSAKRSSR